VFPLTVQPPAPSASVIGFESVKTMSPAAFVFTVSELTSPGAFGAPQLGLATSAAPKTATPPFMHTLPADAGAAAQSKIVRAMASEIDRRIGGH
jgi:hypothetical protein